MAPNYSEKPAWGQVLLEGESVPLMMVQEERMFRGSNR